MIYKGHHEMTTASTLTERAAVADSPTFQARVRQALINEALAITAEDPTTANHAERYTYARQVIDSPYAMAQRMAPGIAQNPNIGTGSSDPSVDSADGDSAMQYVVNTIFDSYITITPAPPAAPEAPPTTP
jgi:hypothetical protein